MPESHSHADDLFALRLAGDAAEQALLETESEVATYAFQRLSAMKAAR